MWTRAELKTRAKDVLRKSYWKAFLVSLILSLLAGGGLNFNGNFGGGGGSTSNPVHSGISVDGSTIPWGWAALFAGIGVIALLTVIAFRVFLVNPLIVGERRYFIESTQYEFNLNHLGYAFGKGRYLGIVKTMFWRAFLNFWWFLLLIIPGIIKSYSYSMVPYLVAENPNIGASRAVQLSRQMTRGQKFRMFVLDLSFIGWYLLGFIALFVGVLFVTPYVKATKAELYMVLRHKALDEGLTSHEELLLVEQ